MSLGLTLKKSYLEFIAKDKRRPFQKFVYSLLIFLSWIYAAVVAARNTLYDCNLLRTYRPSKKLISVGNLSWAGSGKTPLSIWLYEKFSPYISAVVVRRGYGDDENKLLRERIGDVFFALDRCSLVRRKEEIFDLFILDDGFQYRKLIPTVSIVIMGAREFQGVYRLLPASYFREPFSSLHRADIVIVNHSNEIKNRKKIKKMITEAAPAACVYFSDYIVNGFKDLEGNPYSEEFFLDKPVAAFAAIGYPEGFFKKLKKLKFDVRHQVAYPDHHRLSVREFLNLEDKLLREGVKYMLITHKDKYHFPYRPEKIKIVVMEIDFCFEEEARFIDGIKQRLGIDG
jgi:tetraacyldisaccharide 4'-kinase